MSEICTTHLIFLTSHPVTTISFYTSKTGLHLNDLEEPEKFNKNLVEIPSYLVLFGFDKACFTILKVLYEMMTVLKVKQVCMCFKATKFSLSIFFIDPYF